MSDDVTQIHTLIEKLTAGRGRRLRANRSSVIAAQVEG